MVFQSKVSFRPPERHPRALVWSSSSIMVAGSMPACHVDDDDDDDDSSDHEDRNSSSSSSWSESRGSDMSDLTADSALKQAIRFLNRQGDASPDEQPSSDSTSCPIPSMVMYHVTTTNTDNDDNDDDEHEWTTTMIGPATPYSQSNSNTTCRASSLVVSSTSLLTTPTTTCNNKRMIRTPPPPSLSTKMRIQRTTDHNSVSSDEGTPRPVTPTGSWYSNHIKTTTTILPSSSPSSSSKHVTTVPSTSTTTCLVRMVVCLWMVGLVTMFLWSICLVPDDDTSRVDWFVPTWKKLQQAAMAEEARQRLEWRHFIQTVLDEMI